MLKFRYTAPNCIAYASASVTGNWPFPLPPEAVPDEPERDAGVSLKMIAVMPRYPMMSRTAHSTARRVQTSHRPPPPFHERDWRGRPPPGCPGTPVIHLRAISVHSRPRCVIYARTANHHTSAHSALGPSFG